MTPLAQPKLTLNAFLAWEEQQLKRHEFYRGEVFAMVGAKRIHRRVVSSLPIAEVIAGLLRTLAACMRGY